jgi:hypothetical protein
MSFTAAGSQYLQTTPENLPSYPFSINVWFLIDSINSQRNIVLLHNTTNAQRFALFSNTSNQLSMAVVDSAATTTSITSPTIQVNTWYMATGVFESATNRTVYLNGGNATTSTVSRTPTTPTRLLVGAQYTGTITSNFSGNIGEVAIWSKALTASDVNSLYTTAKAPMISTSNLQVYYPLIRTSDITNYMGASTTNNNNMRNGIHYRRYG